LKAEYVVVVVVVVVVVHGKLFDFFSDILRMYSFVSLSPLLGAALSMLIISPIVKVTTSPDLASSLSSGASGNLESSIAFRSTELPQAWQLLTGHGNGVIQVWGDARGMLCPLLRIGGDASPITAVAVHAPMGLICSSHLDGRLVVQAVPHPRGQSALAVTLVDGSVSQVKLRKGEIKVAE